MMAYSRSLIQLFFEVVRLIIKYRKPLDDALFLKAVYRIYLKREIDEDGFQYYSNGLKRKSMTRWDIIRSITQSNEFNQIYGLAVHPLNAQHQARMMLVRNHLPPAGVIVDLGGAAVGNIEGALLAMGYSHHPRNIIIIDLPPEQRLNGEHGSETTQTITTEDGINIRYIYCSMSDMSLIADSSVDMVWSGESIEHVSEAEADIVCQEAYRVLKPGGFFCLDTPNATLTRLQSPDKFIHPEHKKEYYVHELRDKLIRNGFKMLEEKGICPMPNAIRVGKFDYAEMVKNIQVSDKPEEGYLFYFKTVKPV